MEDVVSFYRMLSVKIGKEMPDLHTLMLLYDTPAWKPCRRDAVRFLTTSFGAAAGEATEHMMAAGSDLAASLSAKHDSAVRHGREKTEIFQVNLDNARSMNERNEIVCAKGIVAHEMAHVISGHKRFFKPFWHLHQEEALADLFSCAVMANTGAPEHVDDVIGYRLTSRVTPGAFAVSSTEHSLPAIADAARALADRYARRKKWDFSVCELKKEAEKIVYENNRLLKEWRRFASAAMDLQEAGHSTGDILYLARAAGSSFTPIIEARTPFRAAAAPSRLFDSARNPFMFDRHPEDPHGKRAVNLAGLSAEGDSRRGYAVLYDRDVVAGSAP